MQNLNEQNSSKKDDTENEEEKKKRPIIKSATDLQRLKLEKLMKNPDKPVVIPENPREKDYMQTVPSFVRNVMGSSAGAGSGEFHVYRHLRRKEYARQKCIHAKSMREQLDEEYQAKLEKNRLEAEAKTAKKRAKRLKKKQRAKKPKDNKNNEAEKQITESEEDDDDDDDDDDNKDNQKVKECDEDSRPEEPKKTNDDEESCGKDLSSNQGDESNTKDDKSNKNGTNSQRSQSIEHITKLDEHTKVNDDVCKEKN